MPYKVIQWATGYTGFYALKYALLNPSLEVVGLKCFSAEKAGRAASIRPRPSCRPRPDARLFSTCHR
jgi:hypothetical protein